MNAIARTGASARSNNRICEKPMRPARNRCRCVWVMDTRRSRRNPPPARRVKPSPDVASVLQTRPTSGTEIYRRGWDARAVTADPAVSTGTGFTFLALPLTTTRLAGSFVAQPLSVAHPDFAAAGAFAAAGFGNVRTNAPRVRETARTPFESRTAKSPLLGVTPADLSIHNFLLTHTKN